LVSGNVSKNDCSEIHLLVTTILNDNFLKKQLVEIEKTPQNEYVFKTRVGEHKIILGKMDDLHQKFKNLKSFYSKAIVDKTIDNYSTLNLKYSNQVVCTKK
jgi:cell division protein FtsQ